MLLFLVLFAFSVAVGDHANLQCKLQVSDHANGYYSCLLYAKNKIQCKVYCDEQHKGVYECSAGKPFTPELPYCVRQIGAGKCPVKEEYKSCGSDCAPTCANRGKKMVCADVCVPSCFCKDGLFRNTSGECIKESDCPVQNDDKKTKYTTPSPMIVQKQCELVVKNGFYSCNNKSPVTECRIVCEDEDKGKFACSVNGTFTPKLPRCAKQVHAKESSSEEYEVYSKHRHVD